MAPTPDKAKNKTVKGLLAMLESDLKPRKRHQASRAKQFQNFIVTEPRIIHEAENQRGVDENLAFDQQFLYFQQVGAPPHYVRPVID